jgi:hypothetical protein
LDRLEALEHYVEVQRLRGMPKLEAALRNLSVLTAKEEELQDAVRRRFVEMSVPFEEQVRADTKNRFDFMHDHIAIELKVQGGLPALTRQVDRYLALQDVLGLLVITTRRQHLLLPAELRGKPIRAVWVGSL